MLVDVEGKIVLVFHIVKTIPFFFFCKTVTFISNVIHIGIDHGINQICLEEKPAHGKVKY